MSTGKESSEYGLAKLGVISALLSTAIAGLVEAGVLGPETELTWPMAAVLCTTLLAGAIVTGMYCLSRGHAKTEFRAKDE